MGIRFIDICNGWQSIIIIGFLREELLAILSSQQVVTGEEEMTNSAEKEVVTN